jgi:cell division protein FtsN
MAKHARPQQATRGRSSGGFLLGVFVGLFAGLAIAVGVAFYLNKAPVPFVGRSTPPGKGAESAAVPGVPKGSDKSEKPRFDFYRILPGGEEPVTERELRERELREKSQPKSSPDAPKDIAKDIYFVQAGSFQNPADADSQKAKLALLGLESSVEPTNLPDKGTWYRVRLGPYARVDEINRVRQLLAQNGIEGSLVKIKDSGSGKAN